MVTAVITTCKRTPDVLERAIKSVISQTYKDIELFVVDDSPSSYEYREQIKTMVESYSNQRVVYIPHQKNSGACVARNTGLKAANGEYIAFLDDDDEWLPEKIEKQLDAFKKYDSKTALVYCGRVTVNDTTGVIKERQAEFHEGFVFDILIKKNFIGSTSYPLLRTDVLREFGGFDPQMPAAQDYDVWLRIAQKYKVGYVRESLVRYHIHDGEFITGNPNKKIVALERLNSKHEVYLKKHKEALWQRRITIIDYYSATGHYGKMMTRWLSAVVLRPGAIKENFMYLYSALANAKFRKS